MTLSLLFLLAAQACFAGTFTVTSTEDSGPGSLRQAILNVNAAPGSHRIEFNLPGQGVQTLAPRTGLPAILNPVAIDGYTQPGSKPNALPAGSDAVLLVRLDGLYATNTPRPALTLAAGGGSVRGLIIVRFDSGIKIDGGSGNEIAGNWIGIDCDGVARGNTFEGVDVTSTGFTPASHNIIGGASPADRNVIAGGFTGVSFFADLASGNSVVGNYLGTDPSGRLPRGNIFQCVRVHAATNIQVISNVLAASTGAGGSGINLLSTSGILIQRNLIGISVDFGDLGHWASGIFAQGVTGLQIGGPEAADANWIGCNGDHGIELQGCSQVVVRGNVIGTGATGTEPLGNLECGVLLNGCAAANIGPLNQILHNGAAGVLVAGGGSNEITANSIYDNGGLGIDLGTVGITPNDPGDLDAGANQLQNYPVLMTAGVSGGVLRIQGTLQSLSATVYRLEFFASQAWDPFWIPEGQVYLGSMTVMTDAAGNCVFNFSCPDPPWLTPAHVLTATATDPVGNTSEFSTSSEVIVDRPPSLWIYRTGDALTLSWPMAATAAGYELESAASPTQAEPWEKVTWAITNDGVTCSHAIASVPPGPPRFYRLRR